MSNIYNIRLKSGPKAQLPTTAVAGEPLYTTDTSELFFGSNLTTVVPLKLDWNNLINTPPFLGLGTVSSVSFTGDGTVLSSTPSAPVTTSGTVTATLLPAGQNKFLGGPVAGGPGPVIYRILDSADIPNNAANTSGNAATASNLSGTPALPNGTSATTQAALDDTTKLATTAYTDSAVGVETGRAEGVEAGLVPQTTTVNGHALSGNVVVSAGDLTTGTLPASAFSTALITEQMVTLSTKPSCTVVSTTNLTLSGVQTIDGFLTAANLSIVLATGQSAGAQNGPWVVQTGAWTRPFWYASGNTAQCFQFIRTLMREGTLYQGSVWRQTAAAPITIDTTPTVWVNTPLAVNSNTITGTVPVANLPAIPYGTMTMDSGYVLGRTDAGSGAVGEMSIGSGLSLSGGTLSYSGTASAGVGTIFYYWDNLVVPIGPNNAYEVDSIPTAPSSQAEQVDTIPVTAGTSPVPWEFYLTTTPLGRTMLDGGVWNANWWASVNSVAGGRVSSLQVNVYDGFTGAGTITFSGTGTTRTATVTGGTPFLSTDSGANAMLAGWIYIPTVGVYWISGYTSTHVVTVTVPTTLTNPSAQPYIMCRLLFGLISPTITAITPAYTLITAASAQPQYTLVGGVNDYLCMMGFGISNNTTSVTYVHSGTVHPSNVASPLATLHNQLEGLQGGTSNQYYHLTSAQYSALSNGQPLSDASTDLGALSMRWRNLFVSGVAAWTNGSGTADTGLSRNLAGSVYVGNGTAGDSSGSLTAATLNATTITGTTVNASTTLEVGGSNINTIYAPIANPSFTGSVSLASGIPLKWSTDTGLSRTSPGAVAVGNGTGGSTNGQLIAGFVTGGTLQTYSNLVSFYSGSSYDIGISRISSTVLGIGNGTAGDYSSNLIAAGITASTGFLQLGSNVPIKFYSGFTYDVGLSRGGVGSVFVGNGTAGDYSGTLKAATVNAVTNLQVNGQAVNFTNLAGTLALTQIPTGGGPTTYLRGDGSWNTPSGAVGTSPVTVVYSSTPIFDFSQSTVQQITLTGDATPTFINATAGTEYTLLIRQDSAGGHAFNWPSSYKGSIPAGTTASTCSPFKLIYDGTYYYLVGAPIEGQ